MHGGNGHREDRREVGPRTGERGIALLMTIWILVLLTMIGATFALSMKTGLASARNFKEDTEAYYQAVAACEDAIRFLSLDKERSVDYLDEGGQFKSEEDAEPFQSLRESDFGTVDVQILDDSAKINLNTVPREALLVLLERSGVEDKDAEEIADSVMDWRDRDDEKHLNGAETDYYEDDDYVAKNGPFSTVEELLLVNKMDADILYGNAERELSGIYEHLSICPSSGINVNTVSAETMNLLGVTSQDIDVILQQRGSGPVLIIPPSAQAAGITATASTCFRILSSATPKETTYTRRLEAFVRRDSEGEGYRVRLVQWRDDV